MRLSGKKALVTGSSRGIGREIALRFAREGADVAVNYRGHAEEAEEVARAIEGVGRRAVVLKADVSRTGDCERLVAEAWQALGSLDILVNNAGMEVSAPFEEVTEADFDKVIGTNLKGTFFVSQAVVRRWLKHERPGRIVNISSVHEELSFPGHAAYCAAKGGVRMLTRDLAVELGGRGIAVNAIAPGAIETDINRDVTADPQARAQLLARIPLQRLGQPGDVAAIALFLASDEAAYVTGSTYFVDGGMTWFHQE
jgi:glucose 1-dehydrogenase